MEAVEVEALFISAAFVDKDLPISAGPRLRRQSLPILHDEKDLAGWSAADRAAAQRTFDPEAPSRSREAVTLWEQANELMRLVECEKARRSLWAWAKAKAGGKHLKTWCSEEGISAETGRRRKDRAVSIIAAKTSEQPVEPQCPAACALEGLQIEGERTTVPEPTSIRSWLDEDAEAVKIVVVNKWRGWKEERNAMRRKVKTRPETAYTPSK
jgi:hypothetical protein